MSGYVDAAATRRRLQQRDATTVVRLAGAELGAPAETDGARAFPFVFSDGSVDRYGDTINPVGWQLEAYNRNPIVLIDHDAAVDRVAGTARNVQIRNGQLVGTIELLPAGISPVVDLAYELCRLGILRTVSVGFRPLEYELAKDKSRPGGVDFKRQELLEVSLVPVPANPNCLTMAKAAGLDVDRVRAFLRAAGADWKVGADRELPIDDSSAWDGPAAQARIFGDGDSIDQERARKAHMVYDAAAPDLKGSYKFPFADLKDGKLVAIAAGIRAAASRLPDADLPQGAKDGARAVIDAYEKRMGSGSKGFRGRAAAAVTKDLYDVAWLAYLLQDLAVLQMCAEQETAREGDGSAVPAALADAVRQLGQILVAMTEEEVAELVGDDQDTVLAAADDDDQPADAVAKSLQRIVGSILRHVVGGARVARVARSLEGASPQMLAALLRGNALGETGRRALADLIERGVVARAGRVLSAANEQTLRDAHSRLSDARDMIMTVVGQVAAPSDEGGEEAAPDAEAKALRERKARAAKAQAERLLAAG